jgi:hypothetical protein
VTLTDVELKAKPEAWLDEKNSFNNLILSNCV